MTPQTALAYLIALAATVPVGITTGIYAGSVSAGCAALAACSFLVCLSIAHRRRL